MSTILELQVENVKKLKVIRIVPKGSTVVISGKNDQGKTSALDSIDYAFRGEKHICDEPIRHGEKRARSFIRLSEELEGICTIERKFTPGGTTLDVRNADGVIQKTPQALLDAVYAKISFDPLSFVRMKPMEQLELLRKLVGLDFTELNAARATAFGERTIRNRELEAAKVRLNGYPFNASLPKQPVSMFDLTKQLGAVQTVNESNRQKRAAFERRLADVKSLDADFKQIQADIQTLENQIAEKRVQLNAKRDAAATALAEAGCMEKEIAALTNADETILRQQISAIQTTNASIEANGRYLKAQEEIELLEGTVKGLTAKIQECDEDKAVQIEFAEFPMPGLSFDEARGVLLNGVPFQQGSQARQLQAAVAIGLALNPKVKVILIRDASLLDDDSMNLVSEMAAQAGAQIWLEVVNSKDPAAIVIEDGEIK